MRDKYSGSDNFKEIRIFFEEVKEYNEDLIPRILKDSNDYIERKIFVPYIKSIEHVIHVDDKLVEETIDVISKYKSNFTEAKLIIDTIIQINKPIELKRFLEIFGSIEVDKISSIELEEGVNYFKVFPPSDLIYKLKEKGIYKVNK